MDFFERVKGLVREKGTTIRAVAVEAGLSLNTYDSLKKRGNLPRADEALIIAQRLGTTIEYLLTGETHAVPSFSIRDDHGQEKWIDGDLCLIPILNQKVAAGMGQAMIDDVEIVGQLPFLTRMLRGAAPADAKSLEVRGDSMTGINIFDGDLVVFVPGVIRGDGIYVLQVGDELIVKRVEFDPVSRKIRIMSENPRYQDRVESADGQTIRVVGKVFGWVHAHPY
jgi:SOS-response transcriptional repressor LexA